MDTYIQGNRDATDANWRPGSQGRVGRTVRGNYNLRYESHGIRLYFAENLFFYHQL